MNTGDRVYAFLLQLYPRAFRERYGRAMRDFHRDRVLAARAADDSMLLLWTLTLIDVGLSATAEHFRRIPPGDAVMDTLGQDILYALRGLARRPAFTAIVIATIALGVGVNAAIFSVVNAVLLRPLPYPHADELFSLGHQPPKWLTSDPDFLEYRRDLKAASGLAAYVQSVVTIQLGDTPSRAGIARTSEDFFPVLGVKPLLGRTFLPEEYSHQIAPVVVISYTSWQRDFNGDRSVVGRKLLLQGIPRVVVGVMPPHFDFPQKRTDIWMPLPRFNPDSLGNRFQYYLFVVGRTKPGVPMTEVTTQANAIAKRIMAEDPGKYDPKQPLAPTITPVSDQIVGNTKPYLFALLGAVGFVLLIACANVANLLLVRGEARRKEMALRAALGASGTRLISQLLTESLLLASAGAAIGLALAWAADRALVTAAPEAIPRVGEISVDWRVLSFTGLVTVLTGLLVGLIPAWRASRYDAATTLKEGGKATGVAAGRQARRALVVAEVSLAVTMLSGAGMLVRSLWHLQDAGLGFETHDVLTAKVALAAREYNDARAILYFETLLNRIRALPGVQSAGAVGWLPVVDAGGLWGYRPEAGTYPDGRWPLAQPQQITPGYFKTIGMPILDGRDIQDTDRENAPLVAVISKQFAEQAWPGQRAIGKRFQLGDGSQMMTVVGIVGDIRARGFGDKPEPLMYFPYAQSAKSAYYVPRSMALLIHTHGNPLLHGDEVRRAIQSIDRTVPVSEIRTFDEVAGTSVALRRFNTLLIAAFAALALVLAGIGTYGVISYGVSQRRFEIGVRMALGAEDRSVMGLVMREGLRLAFVGLVLGVGASVLVGRAIQAMLVGVGALDLPSIAVTGVLLGVVALTASFVPAIRALRVNPIEALRVE